MVVQKVPRTPDILKPLSRAALNHATRKVYHCRRNESVHDFCTHCVLLCQMAESVLACKFQISAHTICVENYQLLDNALTSLHNAQVSEASKCLEGAHSKMLRLNELDVRERNQDLFPSDTKVPFTSVLTSSFKQNMSGLPSRRTTTILILFWLATI